MHIFHLIQSLARGGPTRSLITLCKYLAPLGSFQHSVGSLLDSDQLAAKMLLELGVRLVDIRDDAILRQEIEGADLVHLHFWNTPELYDWCSRDLPAMRLLIWNKIAGDKPPQVMTDELLNFADCAVMCCAYSWELPFIQKRSADIRDGKLDVAYSAVDWERISNAPPRSHAGFNVGYIGTVDFAKMHPNYVPMSAQIEIPDARFIVCGGGNAYPILKRQAQKLGVAERFDLRGYVENIESVLERLDVFGYPLCLGTYASAELALQEAMYAGVPPVVLSHGSPAHTIKHNETGLVVANAQEYKEAIEYLYHHPNERLRLGRNARQEVQEVFGPHKMARQMNAIYKRLLEQPKRQRNWSTISHGAELFVQSLGETAPQFGISMTAQATDMLLEAEKTISISSPVLCNAGGGGILHYRRAYPNDPYLRLWAGLVLQQQGRHALASAELTQAIKKGLDHWRIWWYLAQAAAKARATTLAINAVQTVLKEKPTFTPALEMLERITQKQAVAKERGS